MIIKLPAKHRDFYDQFDPLRKELLNKKLPISGVYKLISNRSVGRLLKNDEEGVMYIGKGVILEYNNRIGQFINSINNTSNYHLGGIRYNIEKIMRKFPLENSNIIIILTETPEKLENELLEKYLEEFGELPPFNRILS